MMIGGPDASRTFSERLFEEFCTFHKVPIERICEEDTPTPDYRISLDGKRVAILDGGPTTRPLSLRLYHNPFARVVLPILLFAGLPVSHPVKPDTTTIRLA